MHLYRYTQPAHQRYIIRILFMVPIYAICSWISLVDRYFSLYLETFRDCYESWVVYNFLSLCLAYVGGPGNVINRMAGKEVAPSWLAMTCCLPSLPVDGAYIRMCKQGALQFVFLKPILASLTLLLTWAGVYGDQEIKANKAYPYIAFVYNLSYSMALYSLLLFYLGAHDLLKPYKPLLKFVLVKSVIFLTFWQSILCATLVSNGTLEDGEDGRALQNVLICVEMIIAAAMMQFAFPHADYDDSGDAGKRGFMTNVSHAISLNDVVSDTVHQFAPTYQEYVLHGTEGGAPRKIRMKTHVMMGAEMIAARSPVGAPAERSRASPRNRAESSRFGSARRSRGDERDGAGMLANAGFENSYGTRDVEDDLEDDFGGEWSGSDDDERRAPRTSRGAANSANFTGTLDGGGDGDGSGTSAAWALGDAMAPLHAEGRAGAGTVYDAVVELAAPPEGSPSKPAARTQTQPPTRVHPRAMPAAMDPSRRYAPTSIAPLAPPPAFHPTPRVSPPPGGGPRLGSGVGVESPEFASFVAAPRADPKDGNGNQSAGGAFR